MIKKVNENMKKSNSKNMTNGTNYNVIFKITKS